MRSRLLIVFVALSAWLLFGVLLFAGSQGGPTSTPNQQSQPQADTTAPAQTPGAETQTTPTAESAGTKTPSSTNPSKRTRKKRKTTAKSQINKSDKIVVHHGGAAEITAQLSPGMTQEQALHARENTEQLLASTEANLKKISARQMTPAQQGVVDQVHTYMRQSKAATEAGDVTRAHTLAYKAHLLSDDLARK
jgi:cytoskeletal protein RodZ